MILEYIHADNSKESIKLDLKVKTTNKWINISSKNKLEFIKDFLPAFFSGQKLILFDSSHKQLLKFNQENSIDELETIEEVNAKNQVLFFTSGSSGFPIGAFKSIENLEKEALVLKSLIKNYSIKRVVVTVPFVHIYGVLAGLLLPMYLDDVKLIVKDDFLPYELLQEASDKDTLVVTTPVFIKALAKLRENKFLNSNLFICSTGPLHVDDVTVFEKKYHTNLIQLFGSTETGGIAYKLGSSQKWHPMDEVHISTRDDKLSVSSPFVSKYILNEKILELKQPFITEDIIKINKNSFSLIGRSNKIIKIAGKRISALQIESILESIEEIEKAIVEVVYKKDLLRSEQIVIILQANEKILNKTIKKKISEYYGVLTIPFSVRYEKINHSAMGKKILF